MVSKKGWFSELNFDLYSLMGFLKGTFLLNFPSFENGLSDGLFSKELMILIMLFFIMIFSVIMCFVGKRALSILLFLISGMVGGYTGILFASGITSNPLMQLYFLVIFIFVGFVAVYAVMTFISSLSRTLRLQKASDTGTILFSAFLGSSTSAVTLYFCIYNSIGTALLLFLSLFIIGLTYQFRTKKSRRNFYTYDDLCNLKPLEEAAKEEDNRNAGC